MTQNRGRALRLQEGGASRSVLLALVILGGIGPARSDGARKPQSLPPRAGPATVFKATRPTPAHAIPDLKSRVLFVVRSGEQVTVVTNGVRVPGASSWAAGKTCCGQGNYDPDQQTDILDRVGEGYAPVFHDGLYPGNALATSGIGCGRGAASADCGQPVTLLEPSGLGLWVQVVSRQGRRAWILAPQR